MGMAPGRLSRRFFETTRGRIVILLRGTQGTVAELARELKLTDNAVRSHLSTLERDGLVRHAGLRKGARKPHVVYALTAEAEQLFPKAYDALLNRLFDVLKAKLSGRTLKEALREAGRALARDASSVPPARTVEDRMAHALRLLTQLGGAPQVERRGRNVVIRSHACPLAAVVAQHPETCDVMKALIAETVGAKVQNRCTHSDAPRCEFHLELEKRTAGPPSAAQDRKL